MLFKRLEERSPVDHFVQTRCINHDRLILIKSAGVCHAFFERLDQFFGVGMLKHHTYGI